MRTLIVLPLLLSWVNAFSQQYFKGSLIVCFVDDSAITVAADSRILSTYLNPKDPTFIKTEVRDTSDKITRFDSVFVATAGLVSPETEAIITRVVETRGDLEKTANNLFAALRTSLYIELEEIRTQHREYYLNNYNKKSVFGMFLFAKDNDKGAQLFHIAFETVNNQDSAVEFLSVMQLAPKYAVGAIGEYDSSDKEFCQVEITLFGDVKKSIHGFIRKTYEKFPTVGGPIKTVILKNDGRVISEKTL